MVDLPDQILQYSLMTRKCIKSQQFRMDKWSEFNEIFDIVLCPCVIDLLSIQEGSSAVESQSIEQGDGHGLRLDVVP